MKLTKLAPPGNVRVEAAANAVIVRWDASPDIANYQLAGYTVYFDTGSVAQLAPHQLQHAVQLGRQEHAYVVRGLVNSQPYFFNVRSRTLDGDVSATSLPAKEAVPLSEGKSYALAMYDDDAAATTNNSGYGWRRDNGQGIAGYRNVTQHGKYVDILMMESPAAPNQSIFISPADAEVTQRWPYRNRTLIADLGSGWAIADSLPHAAFTTTAEIKDGHVYLLKTQDDYCIKLRIESITEVPLLSALGAKPVSTRLNKITFTYASQLGQSYSHFLAGKP